LSLLLIVLMLLGTGFIGEEGPLEQVSALDPNSNIEERPGTIHYSDWGPYTVWSSGKGVYQDQNLSTRSQFLSADVDLDGDDELLFGTYNGSLIVLDMPSGVELVNMSFGSPRGQQPTVAVGNTDDDTSQEILFSTWEGLFCIDYRTKEVQWRRGISVFGSSRTLGTMVLVDPDGDGVDEIVMRSLNNYYHLDNEGRVVHNVSLEVFEDHPYWMEDYLGWSCRLIVDDLDGDGDVEVFISDYGASMIPEVYKRGQHVWIIDLDTGVMEYSNEWNNTLFYSDPMLFSHNGSKYITIGLSSYGQGNDTIIIDLDDMSYEMVDVYNKENTSLTFLWISQIPSDDDTILLFGTSSAYAIAWSFQDRKVIWVREGGSGSASVESPLFVCDIDNDKVYEVLLPVGPVHVLDARTGELEKRLDISGAKYRGEKTMIGDFDGDGFTEICQGLPMYWLETFDIVYIDTDIILYDIEVPTDGATMTLYAGIDNEVPIFLRNMTEKRLPSNIELFMSNDLWNTFGEYKLFPGNGSHGTTMDSLITISTYTIEYTDEGTYLNLTMIPDWNFSHEGPNDLSVGFKSAMGTLYLHKFEDLFVVEGDLELTGDIIITHSEEVLREGDWLLPSEPLQMSGLDVVYEGTEALHPPPDAFTLDVFGGIGWSNLSFLEGEALEIDMSSPVEDGEFEIIARIFQVPVGEYGQGRANFTLRVDGTGPHVVDVFPHNSSWFCEPRIPFAILIDDEGSGVDLLSIEYCMVRALNTTDRLWQHVTPDETAEVERGLRAQSEWSFSEGSTYILWRFTDHLGNKGSTDHIVNIDLQGLYFHDFSPTNWVHSRSENISVIVSVSDRGGSGVNVSSLEWSYSHTDLLSFSEWAPVEVSEQDGQQIVLLKYDGVEGKTNLIRFRGRDMAGNEPISSQVYEVWIDTVYPWVEIVDIWPWLRQDPALRSVRVNVTDWTSGIGGVIAFLQEREGEGYWNLTVELVEGTEHWAVYELSWTESTLPGLNLRVHVWDNAGNHFGHVEGIYLDRSPSIIQMSPLDGASFENGTVVNFTIELSDPDGDDLSVEWWLGYVLLSSEANFSTSSLSVGAHNISVIVRDRYHEVVGRLGITVTEVQEEPVEPPQEEPPKVTRETDWWSVWWVVGIVVLISLVAGLLLFWMKHAEVR